MSLVIAFPLEVEHSWSLLCHLVVTGQHKFSHEENLVWFLFPFMPMGYLEYMLPVITIIKMQPFNSESSSTEGKWHSSKYEFHVLYFSLCYLNLDYIFIKRKNWNSHRLLFWIYKYSHGSLDSIHWDSSKWFINLFITGKVVRIYVTNRL